MQYLILPVLFVAFIACGMWLSLHMHKRERPAQQASIARANQLLLECSPGYQQKVNADRQHEIATGKLALEQQKLTHEQVKLYQQQQQEQHKLDLERQKFLLETWKAQTQIAVPQYGMLVRDEQSGQFTHIAPVHRPQIAEKSGEPGEQPASGLPTYVRYEDVRSQVPHGHVLVGVGQAGIDTREERVGACVWIVGLSGTGKTSTTVIRVEERREKGHQFLGVDPHWFKDDSLTNALKPYARDFLMPIAQTPGETFNVLKCFLDEFKGRKEGRIPKPWQKITLLVDEVNALMDATTEEEKEIGDLLKSLARICGQEARNFEMGGIFMSQQATNLAWLRKVALMVIVHQLLMESEKKLACNGDSQVIEEMKTWPIGRTYVYGVGFQDGPRTVQQPFYKPIVVEADPGTRYQPLLEPAHDDFSGTDNISFFPGREQKKETSANVPVPVLNPLAEPTEQGTEPVPEGTDDKQFTHEQEREFVRHYKASGSIKRTLAEMHLSYGRYQKCASRLVAERGLRKDA